MATSISSIIQQSNPYEQYVQQLVQLESRQLLEFQDQQEQINDKKSALGDVSSKVTAFINKIDELSPSATSDPLNPYASSSSDESVVTIDSHSGIEEASSYNITVNRLADKDTMLSQTYDGTASTLEASGAGSVDITIDGQTESITVDPTGKTNKEVLQSFADEINNLLGDKADANVFKLDDAGNVQFSVKSEETGYTNRIQFNNATGVLDQVINTDGMSHQETTLTDLDASFTVDGVNFTRGTNTVDDAINGLTFTMSKESASAEMSVERDIDKAVENIEDLIKTYNKMNGEIRGKTYLDETGQRGILQDERSIRNLSNNLRLTALSDMAVGAGELQNLTQIGISFDNEGQMSIEDEDKLREMLTDRPDEVSNLFNGAGSPIEQMKAQAESYTDADGVLSALEEGYDQRIERLDNRISSEQSYLEGYEERQRRIFAELYQMQQQGQRQLSSISNYQSQLGSL